MNEYRGQYKGEMDKKVNIKWQCDLRIKYFLFKEHFLSKSGATKYAQIISSEKILGHWKGNLETLSLNSALRSTYTDYKDRIVELFSGNTAKFPSKSEREINVSKFRNGLQQCLFTLVTVE